MKIHNIKDLPRVYWYCPFCEPKEDDIYYDTGLLDDKGNRCIVDEEGSSIIAPPNQIFKSLQEARTAYQKDLDFINSHATLLGDYYHNYDGDDKLQFLCPSYYESSYKRQALKYRKLWQCHTTGFLNIRGISLCVKDVKKLRYYRKEGKFYGCDKIELLLEDGKVIKVEDKEDIEVVEELFGENLSDYNFVLKDYGTI